MDFDERPGRVFTYSVKGGISNKESTTEAYANEVQYRLRHLNTGRLVIDQEIAYNGFQIRTLGLSPHLCVRNLALLSDKQVESVEAELRELNNSSDNMILEAVAEGTP